MEVVKRIEELILSSGKTASSVLMDCKLSHNSLINWKSGRAKPSVDAIVKFAHYFNVTTDYLLGLEPPTEPNLPTDVKFVMDLMNTGKYKNLIESFLNTLRGLETFDTDGFMNKMFVSNLSFKADDKLNYGSRTTIMPADRVKDMVTQNIGEYPDFFPVLVWVALVKTVSTSALQREFGIGFSEARKIIDCFVKKGYLLPSDDSIAHSVVPTKVLDALFVNNNVINEGK